MNVEEEVRKLKEEIQRLGQQQPDSFNKVTTTLSFPSSETATDLMRLICSTALSRISGRRSQAIAISSYFVCQHASRFTICNHVM
jgi:hypothetical protein